MQSPWAGTSHPYLGISSCLSLPSSNAPRRKNQRISIAPRFSEIAQRRSRRTHPS